MANEINSLLDPEGSISYKLIKKSTGEVIDEGYKCNLIVTSGKARWLSVLTSVTPVANTVLAKIKLGGGAVPTGGDHLNPIPPVASDTKLVDASPYLGTLPVADTSKPGDTVPFISYFMTFDCADVNRLVNEMGLFFADDVMFSRITTPQTWDLRASSDITLQLTWKIRLKV